MFWLKESSRNQRKNKEICLQTTTRNISKWLSNLFVRKCGPSQVIWVVLKWLILTRVLTSEKALVNSFATPAKICSSLPATKPMALSLMIRRARSQYVVNKSSKARKHFLRSNSLLLILRPFRFRVRWKRSRLLSLIQISAVHLLRLFSLSQRQSFFHQKNHLAFFQTMPASVYLNRHNPAIPTMTSGLNSLPLIRIWTI